MRLIDAGLYDPGAENAPMRLELLVHLSDRGATIEQMIEADRGERLVALVADLKMFDFGIPMTVEQVAEACHVSIDRVMRVRLASGLPAEPGASLPAWAPEDVAGFELGAGFFGEGPVLAFSRVMGASAARVAEAAISLFLSEIEESLDAFGASPVDHAQANEEAADLVSIISILMDHLVREHLDLAVKRQARVVWWLVEDGARDGNRLRRPGKLDRVGDQHLASGAGRRTSSVRVGGMGHRHPARRPDRQADRGRGHVRGDKPGRGVPHRSRSSVLQSTPSRRSPVPEVRSASAMWPSGTVTTTDRSFT